MRSYKLCFSFILVICFGCYSHRNITGFSMEDFNIEAGYTFIDNIENLAPIHAISLTDTKRDGNDFYVNNQNIFLDTMETDQPNYYNYRKRAKELQVSPDSLRRCLISFYKVKVNEFNRENGYYRFPVIGGFTTNKGYVYVMSRWQTGDTLPATSARNWDAHFHIILSKKLDDAWFEYYEIQ